MYLFINIHEKYFLKMGNCLSLLEVVLNCVKGGRKFIFYLFWKNDCLRISALQQYVVT